METTVELRPDAARDVGKLIAALTKAQGEFTAIKRTKAGQQGNRKFKYAPLDEIIGATRPAMVKYGLATITRIEVTDKAAFVVTELRLADTEECIESRYPLTPGLITQERGKEITYGRRYNTCALLDVVGEEGDADDGMEDQPESEGEAEARRKEAEARLDALKAKGNVTSAYDGKKLEPGERTRPQDRAKPEARAGAKKDDDQLPGVEMPAAGSSDQDGLNGVAAGLRKVMQADGITKAMLKAYYVGKGHLPDSVEPEKLPSDYVLGITKPENWKRAVAAMKGAK